MVVRVFDGIKHDPSELSANDATRFEEYGVVFIVDSDPWPSERAGKRDIVMSRSPADFLDGYDLGLGAASTPHTAPLLLRTRSPVHSATLLNTDGGCCA